MARTAEETAEILKDLYNESFGDDYRAPFRLNWDQLRGIAGTGKLEIGYIRKVNEALLAEGYALLTFNYSFIVAHDGDFPETRDLPARLAERHRDDEDQVDLPEDDDED